MSDKKSVLSTDDLAPRPRAVNEAAASQITGGVAGPTPAPPGFTDPTDRLAKHEALYGPPTKPPPVTAPASGKKP